MKDIKFDLDSINGDLSLLTDKLDNLMTSIHWLDRDLFEDDSPTKDAVDSFMYAYRERKIQSELHCEAFSLYVQELKELSKKVEELNQKAWEEFRNKNTDNVQPDQEKTLPATNK